MFLFSQPLIERRVINKANYEIYPKMMSPIDHYGEYRNLARYLKKSGLYLSIKSK
jgi:hypothetical protein